LSVPVQICDNDLTYFRFAFISCLLPLQSHTWVGYAWAWKRRVCKVYD
jgi:hypothetical protein